MVVMVLPLVIKLLLKKDIKVGMMAHMVEAGLLVHEAVQHRHLVAELKKIWDHGRAKITRTARDKDVEIHRCVLFC